MLSPISFYTDWGGAYWDAYRRRLGILRKITSMAEVANQLLDDNAHLKLQVAEAQKLFEDQENRREFLGPTICENTRFK